MSHKLIDRNDDLRRLREKGYNIDIHVGYLVVRDIPYVNDKREVFRDGVLVTNLDVDNEVTRRPGDHQIRFAGRCPCDANGNPLHGIRPNKEDHRISEKVSTQYHFSAKPPKGHYDDYYQKVTTYASLISGPATAIEPDARPTTYQVVEPEDDDSPFRYLDTASARAEINMITAKLAVSKVAIVGLGGTGSYVLDLMAKTPVREIHIFDEDKFSSHNAYRAPGAASGELLHTQPLKVDYFKSIYDRLHKRIIAHPEHVTKENIQELREMSCVFLCMDANPGKRLIVEKLEEYGVTFIDTGMGLYAKKETLGGILRVTTSTPENRDQARGRLPFASEDEPNEYDKNIQIADLNALNAILAVMRWKKLCGFYFDFTHEHFNSFTVGTNQLLNEDLYEPN